jgi:hypothetical protein
VEQFSWSAIAEQTLELYRSVAEAAGVLEPAGIG